MKKLCTVLLISLWTLNADAQILKKTYYDVFEKNIHEVYYANSAGYGNGSYKKYDERGALIETGTYKDGKKTGEWIKYSTYIGKRTISLKENYKDDKLHGSAIYYAKSDRVMSKGSYLEDEKHGTWEYENPFDSYGYSDEDKKGAKYLKFTKTYDKGKEIHHDGEEKIYYSPSGKVCSVASYLGGNKHGEWNYYYPNGDVSGTEIYENGKLVMAKYFHTNKQLKLYKDWRDGYTYEAYDENGNPDQETLKQRDIVKAIESFKSGDFVKAKELFVAAGNKKYATAMSNLVAGEELHKQGKYQEALIKIDLARNIIAEPVIESLYDKVYKDYIVWLDTNFSTWAASYDVKTMTAWLASIKTVLKPEDSQKYDDLTQETTDHFNKIQALDEKIKQAVESLELNTYSKHKLATIEKFKLVIDSYSEAYALELTFEKMMQKGQQVIDVINKVIGYTDDECKDLNKQLKNVDDPEQIKAILKI